MNSTEYFLGQAEQALRNINGQRRNSEISFLQRLLRELDGPIVLGLSPAGLFREVVRNGAAIRRMQDVLGIVALPSRPPNTALRAGDWMIRVVRGTGDVGHVSILASDDLFTPSMLASEDIASEGVQPGFYGTVIEGGAFPHSRTQPFARRVLDSDGRAPAHTLILRPRLEESDVSQEGYTPPSWLKVEQRGRRRLQETIDEFRETEAVDVADKFRPPSWLKVEQRGRTRPEPAGYFEATEDFTFDPTGEQTDFGPQLRKAWHDLMRASFVKQMGDAVAFIQTKVSISDAAAAARLRLFNPAAQPSTIKLTGTNIIWNALPRSGGPPSWGVYESFDKPQMQTDRTGLTQLLRAQDEYCEWQVFRNSVDKIVRVVFTCEPPEYCEFLYDPGVSTLTAFSRNKLVEIYRERCGDNTITLPDLEKKNSAGNKVYNRANKWNNQFCVHLQQLNNTLGAEINIAAHASVVYSDSTGTLISDIKKLFVCDPFGEPSRQSDPSIGDNVNKLARENRFITLENPVGLYMTSLDTSGWTTPDGTDAQSFWKVLKGSSATDPGKSMIVRAEFAVPAIKRYTVSDISIAGEPIKFGSQIAEHVGMRLGAVFGPKDVDLDGRKLSAPTPVVC